MNNNSNDKQKEGDFWIVAIGASAGGLKAIEEFFDHLLGDSNAAFVLIQHLSPDFKSLMKEILEKHTNMKLHRVQDGMKLKPNNIYLIPNYSNLIVREKRLYLVDRTPKQSLKSNLPINLFFKSLAENKKEKIIGIVLSGTGSDGSLGLQDISEAGGVCLVQSPSTAEFDGMPSSAIATGVVDRTLPPNQLASLVYEIVKQNRVKDPVLGHQNSSQLDSGQLRVIIEILKSSQDIDFAYYKSTTFSRRTLRRCSITGYEDVNSYIDYLENSLEEQRILKDDLLIGVTRFFRDLNAWQVLESKIIAYLQTKKLPSHFTFRAWVSACSSGEEAYSLAIMLDRIKEKTGKEFNIKIFATDLDGIALTEASKGIYSESISDDIPEILLRKYFAWRGDKFHIVRYIREMIIFAPHNLVKNAAFTQMDLVTCRNVLIYLRSHLQDRVLRRLHFSLASKGILFLGESESLGNIENEFLCLDSKWKIFQKLRDVRLPFVEKNRKEFCYDTSLIVSQPYVRNNSHSSVTHNRQKYPLVDNILHQALVDIYAARNATCILIDKNGGLIHTITDKLKLLQVPQGKQTNKIVSMLPEQLSLPVSTGISRAIRSEESITYTDIHFEIDDRETKIVNLTIKCGRTSQTTDAFLTLIVEEQQTSHAESAFLDSIPVKFSDKDANQHIDRIEYELQQTRENLQATIEELETSNEEQQSSNEELLASNEELQSTNEELQSVNEELYTVNSEYQSKISELTQLTNDVENLLRSTGLGVVFLDRQLKIRKFTQAASKAINLVESDLERPLFHLTHNLEDADLQLLCQQVLETETSIEKQVKIIGKKEYLLMRINPYRCDLGLVAGIVMNFVPIDELKKLEEQLLESNQILETTYQTAPVGLCLVDENLCYQRINSVLAKINGLPVKEHIGKTIAEVLPELKDKVIPLYQQVLETGEPIKNMEITGPKPSNPDEIGYWMASYYRVEEGVSTVVVDISQRKDIERQLTKNQEYLHHLLSSSPAVIFSGQIKNNYPFHYISDNIESILGYDSHDFVPQRSSLLDYVHPDEYQQVLNCFKTILVDRICTFEARFLHADGYYRWLRSQIQVTEAEKPAPEEYIGYLIDISDRKSMENEMETKSNFLACMSHEIRTPMNGVIGMLDLIESDKLSAAEQFKINVAKSSAESLLTLIDDILDYSQVNSGILELESVNFHLIELLGMLAQSISLKAEEKNIELILDLRGIKQPFVKGDPNRLRQIVTNLISNAIKFTDSAEEIIVRAKLEQQPNQNGQYLLTISVIDRGIGVSQEKLDHIFELFTQHDNSITRRYGGTGLGLSIVRKLCQLMGGDVNVESTIGEGSTFTVRVYLQTSDSNQPSLPYYQLDNLKILLIENNQSNRNILSSQLRDWGATVVTAIGGKDALFMCEDDKYQFNLFLIDVSLMEMDVIESIEKIREYDKFKKAYFLLLTPITYQPLTANFVNLESIHSINKPISNQQLWEKVSLFCSRLKHKSQTDNKSLLDVANSSHNKSQNQQNLKTRSNARVLLVEDNPINQMVFQGLLDKNEIENEVAINGVKALEMLRNAPVDRPYNLVLMDCLLPQMNGYETAQKIRQGEAGEFYRNLTIIAIISNPNKEDKKRCLSAGMNDYLSKPIKQAQLIKILKQWQIIDN